ncbi:MAG: glucose-1-phosphate cytidylyltransferase [Pseudomonadota bacterium]
MKVVILAGGTGSRLAEETSARPKPMVEIGGKPMLWHIMNIYAAHGFKEFIVACGFKAEAIKEYFHDFFVRSSDFTIDLKSGKTTILSPNRVEWRVTVIDTGLDTLTGGRLLRLTSLLGSTRFMVTYGDGVADIDLRKLLAFHLGHGKLATVTAVRPPARFGGLDIEGDTVKRFAEKPQIGEGWINGGFFVFEPDVFAYLAGDDAMLEQQPLERLANDGQLMAYRHDGFWQPMDTLREKQLLEALWASGRAAWKIWA